MTLQDYAIATAISLATVPFVRWGIRRAFVGVTPEQARHRLRVLTISGWVLYALVVAGGFAYFAFIGHVEAGVIVVIASLLIPLLLKVLGR